jgi:hypothetical protein
MRYSLCRVYLSQYHFSINFELHHHQSNPSDLHGFRTRFITANNDKVVDKIFYHSFYALFHQSNLMFPIKLGHFDFFLKEDKVLEGFKSGMHVSLGIYSWGFVLGVGTCLEAHGL